MDAKTSEKEVAVASKEIPQMPAQVKLNFDVPQIQEFLKTGAQFGHQTQRWNPKMSKYIFSKKGNVHIIDLAQTLPLLDNALKFLVGASSKGRILFVGTKKQAASIIFEEANRSGSYYINYRWPGGLFTNFKMIKKSLKRLAQLEQDFEAGVEGRTKYEVSRMKKEWERLNRLYSGVKTMDRKPRAVVIIDPNYEKNAVRESINVGVPIISLVDTNCDPAGINYPIPANDDALKSLKLFMKLFADATLQGNEGKGVVHENKDYTKFEVKVIKEVKPTVVEEEEIVTSEKPVETKAPVKVESKPKTSKSDEKGGMLGRSRDNQPKFKIKKTEEKAQKTLEDLKLSAKATKSITDAALSIEKLEKMTKDELLAIDGIGEKAAEQIMSGLKK